MWLIVWIIYYFLVSAHAQQATGDFTSKSRSASLHCPFENNPTIGEILDAAIPWDSLHLNKFSLKEYARFDFQKELQLIQFLISWKTVITDFRPMYLLWLTMGRYVVKFDESVLPSLSFNDVYIVQESHFRYNPLCAVALPQGIPIVSSICHCDDKYRLENTEWSKSSILLDKTSEDKSQWCIRKAPCTSRDLTLGVCEIFTDPARRSCLLLEHNNNDGIWEELDKLVKFEMSIPKLKSLLPTGWMKRYRFDYERMVKGYVGIVLDQIPLYLFNLTIGLFIMYFAKDLADDKGFQAIIQGLIGIFLGLFVLLFVFQR